MLGLRTLFNKQDKSKCYQIKNAGLRMNRSWNEK